MITFFNFCIGNNLPDEWYQLIGLLTNVVGIGLKIQLKVIKCNTQ
jgi:hypothetical protein